MTRRKNEEIRDREYLTQAEAAKMVTAAKVGRNGARNALIVRMLYCHGLRVSELCALRWSQVDTAAGLLHIRRRKKGIPATHPLQPDCARALRRMAAGAVNPTGPVFVSERGGPLSERSVHNMVATAGVRAALPWPVHPHQLRHGAGYHLAQAGYDLRHIQVYLGHTTPRHTARYTALSSRAFDALTI